MPEKMLVTVDQVNPLEIFVKGKYKDLLEFIKQESKIEKPDVSTAKGRALIKSMAAKIASSKVFIVKGGKDLSDAERKKIADTLEKMNTSRKFIEDSLVYLKAEVREPLTKWEDDKKKIEEMIENHASALVLNTEWDEKKEIERQRLENEAEKKRLEKEKVQLNANSEAIKNFGSASQVAVNDAVKGQGVAEDEAKRIREKAESDAKQAKIDQDQAVEDERVRVQKIADDKETKRLENERIKREAEEKRAADLTHRKAVNNKALDSINEILARKPNEKFTVGQQIIISIIEGKIPDVFIKY